MSDNFTLKKQNPGQLNSVQLNIVSVIDVHKALKTESVKDTIYMMDNSVGGSGQGTGHLQTVCKPGQVLNWIIYPMDMEKKPDGTWPPFPKISNIVFLDSQQEGDTEEFSEFKVLTELKIYGSVDLMRSPYCPVYYYWAGAVLSTLPPGVYNYRFILELEKENKKDKIYLNTVEKPSLKVVPV